MTEPEEQKTTNALHPLVEFLRDRRVDLRISQSAVADMMGSTQGAVSGWERGIHIPNVEHLDAWARVLGFRVRLLSSKSRR